MAIAFDVVSTTEQTGTSISWSHTCSGSNRILLVGIALNADVDRVTGVTYASVSMTRVLFQANASAGLSGYVYILTNPTSGANTITVSISPSSGGQFKGISYTGANQSNQPDASGSQAVNANTTHSLAITTLINNCWAITFLKATNEPTASTNVTSRQIATNFGVGDSNSDITPAGSFTQAWTTALNSDSWQIHTSIAPVTTTSTSTSTTSTSTSSSSSTSTSTSTSTTKTETTTSTSTSTTSTSSSTTTSTSSSTSTSTTSTSSSTTSTSSSTSSSSSSSTSTTTTYPYPFTVDNVG